MKIVKKQLVVIIILCILILMGCNSKEDEKKVSVTGENITVKPTVSDEVAKDYSIELSEMGDLLYYLAYATAFSDERFPEDVNQSKEPITLDEQIVWDSMYMVVNSQDFEIYEYEEYEPGHIKVELTKDDIKNLRKETFIMNGEFTFKDEYCTIGTIEKDEESYIFYLGELENNKAYFDIEQIVPRSDEREFSLQVRLMKGTTDNVNEIAMGEVVVKRNEKEKQFKYAIKSMNLEQIDQKQK